MHVQEHEDQNECIYFVQQLEVSYAPGTITGVRDTTIRQSLYLSSSPGKSGCRGMIKKSDRIGQMMLTEFTVEQ